MCDRKSRNTGKGRDFLYSETSHFNKTSSGGVGISGAANMEIGSRGIRHAGVAVTDAAYH